MPTLSTYPQLNYRGFSHSDKKNTFSSPTFNQTSHGKWSANHFSSLNELHKTHKPTHWLTIKVNNHQTTDRISHFLTKLRESITNQNKRNPTKAIAVFGLAEIGSDDTVHFHVLVRTQHDDPQQFISKFCNKYNMRHQTIISVPYCETPDDGTAITSYSLKINHQDIRLFQPGSLTRYTWTAGNYFAGHKRKTLRETNRETWSDEQVHELSRQVEMIAGYWEPSPDNPDPPPVPQQEMPPEQFHRPQANHRFVPEHVGDWLKWRHMPRAPDDQKQESEPYIQVWQMIHLRY